MPVAIAIGMPQREPLKSVEKALGNVAKCHVVREDAREGFAGNCTNHAILTPNIARCGAESALPEFRRCACPSGHAAGTEAQSGLPRAPPRKSAALIS
jgi:hypothetical protein